MNGKRTVNLRAALAGVALAVCAMPGASVAQSSYSDHSPNRDGYGTSSIPHYAQLGDPAYSDYRYRSANAATRHGTVEAVELEKQRQRGETQRISVRMDDGTSRVFTQDVPELRAGDRVRVERDGHLELA